MLDGMTDYEVFKLGGYPLDGLIRRIRRTARLSQRDLARAANVAPSAVAAFETGRKIPSLASLQRMLHAANYQLVVIDEAGHLVIPLEVWDGVADLAGRRFPAHLDLILDPVCGEWWADGYGLTRPPETFRRSRGYRTYLRRLSQWEVRVAKFRTAPRPQPPRHWEPGDPMGEKGQRLPHWVIDEYDETSFAPRPAVPNWSVSPPPLRRDDPGRGG
jgi:transcriptional regulator with XRE-family HTH domain